MQRTRADKDVFAGIATDVLSDKQARRIQEDYEAQRFNQIFPAGSLAIPSMLVSRTQQMRQLSALAAELLEKSPSAQQSLIGIVLHGPRGTGKTTLLKAFSNGMRDTAATQVINMTGSGELSSMDALLNYLAAYAPKQSTSTTFQVAISAGVEGHLKRTTSELATEQAPLSPAHLLRALASATRPILLTIDEAHAADPRVLGSLLNSIRGTIDRRQGISIGIVLAGTPDTLNALRHEDCKATWFMDRADLEGRLAAVPNDLSIDDCGRAIREPLLAAGITIENTQGFERLLGECKGSPYFLQLLGSTALSAASQNDDIADFTRARAIDLTFERRVNARYHETWSDLDKKGLSACARQMGALWRKSIETGRIIKQGHIYEVIESGLTHAPRRTGRSEALGRIEDAEATFEHLGLLWSMTGHINGPWDLGLPSFFDFVEEQFQDAQNIRHHRVLPALEMDMQRLFQEIGPPAQS